jgi:hypothetical protein
MRLHFCQLSPFNSSSKMALVLQVTGEKTAVSDLCSFNLAFPSDLAFLSLCRNTQTAVFSLNGMN